MPVTEEAVEAVSTATSQDPSPTILERPQHSLSRKKVADSALKVLYRLHRSGYLACLVGGGVRDILLGRQPKDFDVVTNARPQEIRRLFRNSRIIGRRFRLVHVMFQGEVVEVATFRASPEAPEGPDDWEEAAEAAAEDEAQSEVDAVPTPRDDDANTVGTPHEDAQRRDFTVNGLFYNIADFTVIDYVGGLADLEARLIRTIGEPEQRFVEDPVRMMRALEYSTRLGFQLDPAAAAAISRCAGILREASAARLTYELLETLRSESAAGICAAWDRAGLFGSAFGVLGRPTPATLAVLGVVDGEVAAGRHHHDASLLGGFYLEQAVALLRELSGDGQRLPRGELLDRLRELLEPAATEMHLPNHTMHLMHQGLFTLSKLNRAPERGRQVLKLARQAYFPVAWDLARFAVEVGLLERPPVAAWAKALHRVEQGAAPEELDTPQRRTRRRRPRRRKRS